MTAILLKAALTFACTVALHVLIWRIKRPLTYAAWAPLLIVIFVLGGAGIAAFWVYRLPLATDAVAGSPGVQWLAVAVLQASIGLVYTIGYTLILVGSPSLVLLKRLAHAPAGLLLSEIDLPMANDSMIGPRVENLTHSGLIDVDAGRALRLAPKGRRLTGCVLLYRHIIGLPDGGGG